jgi:hypothetical protein
MFYTYVKLFIRIAGMTAIALYSARASCILDWNSSRSGNVREFKYVQEMFHIYEPKLDVPVNLIYDPFNASNEMRGWSIPLVQSSIVALDDDSFLVILPTGQSITLKRRTGDQFSSYGWTAVKKGNNFTLTSACGSIINYRNGVMHQLKGDGFELNYKYIDGGVELWSSSGALVLKYKSTSKGGERTLIITSKYGNNEIGLSGRPGKSHVATLHNGTGAANLITNILHGDDSIEMRVNNRGSYIWNKKSHELTDDPISRYSHIVVEGVDSLRRDFKDGSFEIRGEASDGLTSVFKDKISNEVQVVFSKNMRVVKKPIKLMYLDDKFSATKEVKFFYDEDNALIKRQVFLPKLNSLFDFTKFRHSLEDIKTGKEVWSKRFNLEAKMTNYKTSSFEYIFEYRGDKTVVTKKTNDTTETTVVDSSSLVSFENQYFPSEPHQVEKNKTK